MLLVLYVAIAELLLSPTLKMVIVSPLAGDMLTEKGLLCVAFHTVVVGLSVALTSYLLTVIFSFVAEIPTHLFVSACFTVIVAVPAPTALSCPFSNFKTDSLEDITSTGTSLLLMV